MKTVFFRVLLMATASAVVVGPLSVSWARPLDAPPEAIITGSALLVLASILRYSRFHSREK